MPLNLPITSPFTTGTRGELVYPLGSFDAINDFNKQHWSLGVQTFDATQTSLLRNSNDSTSKVILDNNSSYFFLVVVTASDSSGNTGIYFIKGAIKRGANAAATALVDTQLKDAWENTAAWDATVTADTTNGALDVKGTGAAATTINWGAEVILWKVPYAA